MTDPDEATLEKVRAGMRAIKVASAYDKVYNDECVLSFDTPFSPEGLYVSLSSFQGYGQRHVMLDHERTGNALYIHSKWTKVPKEVPSAAEADLKAPTRMAIGGEGGFNVSEEKFDVVKENSLVIMPEAPLRCAGRPWPRAAPCRMYAMCGRAPRWRCRVQSCLSSSSTRRTR